MSGGRLRMHKWHFLVMMFTVAILYIGLYTYQEERVEMATIIKPGKRNIQTNLY